VLRAELPEASGLREKIAARHDQVMAERAAARGGAVPP